MKGEIEIMPTTMVQHGNVQFLFTCPDNVCAKRGVNPVTDELRDRERVDNSPMKYQRIVHKKTRAFNKLMNCKTVEKFDSGTHEEYPKAHFKRLRPMRREEVRAWIQAGAEIQADPWSFVRKIVYQNRVLGSCSDGDIKFLMRSGLVQQIQDRNGSMKYHR